MSDSCGSVHCSSQLTHVREHSVAGQENGLEVSNTFCKKVLLLMEKYLYEIFTVKSFTSCFVSIDMMDEEDGAFVHRSEKRRLIGK